MTEVEALKRAVAEAEKKAATERTLREKHEARVIKAEQELQEAVSKCKALEQSLTEKESELTKARQATSDAQGETQSVLQGIQEARKITAGKLFPCKENIGRKNYVFDYESGLLRCICRAAAQYIRCRSLLPSQRKEHLR